MKILRALPGSRLVMQAEAGSHQAALRAWFEQGGVAGGRVAFVPRAGRAAYFERFQQIDVGLDPFPYNGHTSTLDALWMGVPVVTRAGRTAVGRGAVSILSNLELHALIAGSDDEYVQIAVALACDATRLGELRSGLRARMEGSPLVDARQYAAAVEAAFRAMWRTWCDSMT
jgi:predicted O-linked N-acetylglucosamine transferase (SPINDLY family)